MMRVKGATTAPPPCKLGSLRMKHFAIVTLTYILSACGAVETAANPQDVPAQATPNSESDDAFVIEQNEPDAVPPTPTKTNYWGVKEGDPLTLMWEDLMPEGSEEDLMREYEEFYSMLEQRYAANTTTLADADPYGAIAEGTEFDYMPQLGSFETVDELDGEYVRIPGYVVPFDLTSKMRQRTFLFVPYMGACIHTPPPPPNQIIFINADPPLRVKDIWAPYWIEGTLSTQKTENDLGDTAYSMQMSSIEPYSDP